VDPHPRGAAAPVIQEHPLAVPETAEAKMAPMFKEIAAGKPTAEGSVAAAIASLGQLATLVGARIVEHASLIAARKVTLVASRKVTLRSTPGDARTVRSEGATPSEIGGAGRGSGGAVEATRCPTPSHAHAGTACPRIEVCAPTTCEAGTPTSAKATGRDVVRMRRLLREQGCVGVRG
jgi:hypothetical protein